MIIYESLTLKCVYVKRPHSLLKCGLFALLKYGVLKRHRYIGIIR